MPEVRVVRVTLISGNSGALADVYAYPKIPLEMAKEKISRIAAEAASRIAHELDLLATNEAAREEAARMQTSIFENDDTYGADS